MTSHAVSRDQSSGISGWQQICGWWASRVFCRDSFPVCLHFTHKQDHDYVLYWCGVHWALFGWLVLFLSSKKRENEENFDWMRSVVNSWEAEVKKISTVVVDISYHWAFITTHFTSQKVQPAVMSKTYAANSINERCLFLSLMAWCRGIGLRDIDRVTQFTR